MLKKVIQEPSNLQEYRKILQDTSLSVINLWRYNFNKIKEIMSKFDNSFAAVKEEEEERF